MALQHSRNLHQTTWENVVKARDILHKGYVCCLWWKRQLPGGLPLVAPSARRGVIMVYAFPGTVLKVPMEDMLCAS